MTRYTSVWLTVNMPSTDTYPADLLAAGEAVKMLPISRSTLLRAEQSGRITPLRTPGGHRRYRRADLIALLEPVAEPAA